MKRLPIKVLAFMLGFLLITGCGGGGGGSSGFTRSEDADAIDINNGGTSGSLEKPGSIEFVSADPETIALKGTGGPPRSEVSNLVFRVVDAYGNPVPDQVVKFELSTEIGGLSLTNTSDVSDSAGLVYVSVNAGNVSTHIRVHATIADYDPLITVVSDQLVVSTGLPDQNSASLSFEILNSESWDYDNVVVSTIFIAADHFNNFVPDGCFVYFTTEGGSIDASGMTTDGVCEVNWRSSGPRPENGRVTILAFCIGEESFFDYNGNGFFDKEDKFDISTDMAEPYRDDNKNGNYDYGEAYWDYDDDGEFNDEPNDMYNGTLCSRAAEDSGLCTRELVYVQRSIEIIMSGSFAIIGFSDDPIDLRVEDYKKVYVFISDVNGNVMPCDSKINLSTSNGKVVGEASYKVANTNKHGPLVLPVLITASKDDGTTGFLQVEVETPFGNLSTESALVFDNN